LKNNEPVTFGKTREILNLFANMSQPEKGLKKTTKNRFEN
jgi:hypothetical protein